MDKQLLELLVCPLCKGPLELKRSESAQELICYADRLAYPIRDGIPLMLENEARAIDPETETRPEARTTRHLNP
ncbi:Trm112 family protein [Roseateles albus]|uniref:UPF0434 protein PRZ03_04840 n=1 Tax=Roseateles albus TaxID=2987525 RepID=A0ABT5KAB8_9BURK|nr:Trm112 family protein [Roseateles albus]MDC8770889.1 Trm112 family protein [Roseateles albus]